MKPTLFITILFSCLLSGCIRNQAKKNLVDVAETVKPIVNVKKTVPLSKEDSALFITWTNFKQAIGKHDKIGFRKCCMDSVDACGKMMTSKSFISKCFDEVFDAAAVRKFSDDKLVEQLTSSVQAVYFSKTFLNKLDYQGDIINLRKFQVDKELTEDGAWIIILTFIKTKQGFRFFGVDAVGGACCHNIF